MAASLGRMKRIAWRHFLTETKQKENECFSICLTPLEINPEKTTWLQWSNDSDQWDEEAFSWPWIRRNEFLGKETFQLSISSKLV